MDPRLIGRKDLQVAASRHDRGSAPLAVVALLAALVGTGGLAVRQRAPAPVPQVLARSASVNYIDGTLVPLPPPSLGLTATSAKGPAIVFRPSRPLTAAQSSDLFSYYIDTMQGQGWTLLGKGDPSPTGEWTLRWQFQGQATLISMFTSPRDKLAVDLCPPEPYC